MDNVLVDFKSGLKRASEKDRVKYQGDEDDIPDLFSKMDAMPGAIEAFQTLSKHFDTYILSTAPWDNPSAWSDKLEWVKKHLGKPAYKRLILTHHKDLNRGDILIDDREKNGAGEFRGELIRFDPENPNWPALVDKLVSRFSY